MTSENQKISYRVSQASVCPICSTSHNHEELMTGRGRLIAGDLTTDFRRLYKPSAKWGIIYPLAYDIYVCPKCLFSSFQKDFQSLTADEIKPISQGRKHRQELITTLFSNNLDFTQNRDLILGAASYILAIDCYHFRQKKIAPTPKQAVSALRAAWLLDDLFKEIPFRPYDKAKEFYYLEATMLYNRTLDILNSQSDEPIESSFPCMAPALTANWGFDSIIYLSSFLTLKYLDHLSPVLKEKIDIVIKLKKNLSKLYGTGKASSSRPAVIVNSIRDLYENLDKFIKKNQENTEAKSP